jgi:DNA polymerase III subunit beta
MKLQVTQENLNKALNNVAKVANSRNSLPILSNVLIKTIDNRVCIAATNLNIAITHYLGSKIKTKGSITVPARLTQDFIASLPRGPIDLELDGTKLQITSEDYKSTINGTLADDYPVMPTIKQGTKWSVDSKELKKALSQVVFAASSDEARPVLTGVYFHTTNNELFVAATDSYRLAEKRVGPVKETVSALIPASSAQDLLRIIADDEGVVSVINDEQQILFQVGDTELVTRLIDGNYPDYKKLLPKSFKTSAIAERAELLNIAKVSSLFARESAGSVIFEADAEQNKIKISSIASQLGENTSLVSAKVSGDSAAITLNSRYIIDALGAVSNDEVEIGFNEKLEPFAFTDKSEGYTHIIMPLKG